MTQQRRRCDLRSWEIAEPSPTFDEVEVWWQQRAQKQQAAVKKRSAEAILATQRQLNQYLSQVVGATPKNKHGFKYSQNAKSTSVEHETQYMSTMSLELHVNTRGSLYRTPRKTKCSASSGVSNRTRTLACPAKGRMTVEYSRV